MKSSNPPVLPCTCISFLISAVFVIGCSKPVGDPLPVAEQVKPLAMERISTGVRFSATVKEKCRVDLSFKVNGLVKDLLQIERPEGIRDVQEGDVLSADSVVARLDDADYQPDQRSAGERLNQLKARLVAATASAENAKVDLDRMQKLAPKKIVSQSELDVAIATMKTSSADLAAIGKEICGAELELEQATDRLMHSSLIIPFQAATVAAKHIEKNERIVANSPALTGQTGEFIFLFLVKVEQ